MHKLDKQNAELTLLKYSGATAGRNVKAPVDGDNGTRMRQRLKIYLRRISWVFN
jgi:hypothetical protein